MNSDIDPATATGLSAIASVSDRVPRPQRDFHGAPVDLLHLVAPPLALAGSP